MMLICSKCKTNNSDRRKFCRECGSLIANFCRNCGFHNSFGDKYCGGCGFLMSGAAAAKEESKEGIPATAIPASAKFTAEDVKELIEAQSGKKEKKAKKKETEDTGELSQEELDRLFEKGNG